MLRAALLITVLALAGSAPAAAGTEEVAPPRLTVSEQTTWVPPDGVFALTLSPEAAPIDPEGSIRVRLRDAVANRNEFTIGLGEAGPGPVDTEIAFPTALALRGDGSLALTLATDPAGPLPIDTPGVYPLDLDVDLTDGGTVDLLTHLVRVPTADERPLLRVAVVVPIGDGPLVGLGGAVRTNLSAEARVERRVDPLIAVPGVPLTVVPGPETVESMSTTPAGQSVVDGLARSLSGRQVLGSTYVEVDEADWVDSGLTQQLGLQMAAGEGAVEAAVGRDPDLTTRHLSDAPAESTLPVLIAEGAERLVVPAQTIPPEGRPADGGPWIGPVLLTTTDVEIATAVTDADLQAHADSTGDPVLDAHRTLADLATVALDRPIAPAGMVLTLPETGEVDRYLQTLLANVGGGPLAPVTLRDWFDEVAPTPAADAGGPPGETLARSVAPREPGGLVEYHDSLALSELAMSGLDALTDGTDPTLGDLRRQALASGSVRLTPAERSSYLSAVGATIRERIQLIDTPADQTVTLTSRSGSIPVSIRNLMGNPARVQLQMSSARLEFPEGARIEVALDDELTTVAVPVRARTTGSFQMEVAVTSPDGVLAVTATQVTIRSTAVSGVGVILAIGAGLVLVTWWMRHWRERRRDARLIPPPA